MLLYPIQKSLNGYRFETYNGVEYEVYFTQLVQYSDKISASGLDPNSFYYFGIHKMNEEKISGKPDILIKRTVALTIFSFFTQYPDAVMVFNYSSTDGRINSRRRKFKSWFDEYSESTTIRMFQHDFSDEFTVCALYKRGSSLTFEKIQENIEALIKNLDNTSKT